MSKSLKKLIDIDRLKEFKSKLVGADSAYVHTTAVDQTIAGTKTFSKPIVGSVTGSSGSCTGNAASANVATYANSAGNGVHSTGGTWIRFNSGIQILVQAGMASNTWHTFSVPFSSIKTMAVVVSPVDNTSNSLAAKVIDYTTTSFGIFVYNNDNNNIQYSVPCTVFAMGFWK